VKEQIGTALPVFEGQFMDERPDGTAGLQARDAPLKAPFLVSPELAPAIDQLRTEALPVREWAERFKYSDKAMRRQLKKMAAEGRAWKWGARWQIPLLYAGDRYLIDAGLLAPALSRKEAIEVVDLVEAIRMTRYGPLPSGSYGRVADL
jgi:hypothetical protein